MYFLTIMWKKSRFLYNIYIDLIFNWSPINNTHYSSTDRAHVSKLINTGSNPLTKYVFFSLIFKNLFAFSGTLHISYLYLLLQLIHFHQNFTLALFRWKKKKKKIFFLFVRFVVVVFLSKSAHMNYYFRNNLNSSYTKLIVWTLEIHWHHKRFIFFWREIKSFPLMFSFHDTYSLSCFDYLFGWLLERWVIQ